MFSIVPENLDTWETRAVQFVWIILLEGAQPKLSI